MVITHENTSDESEVSDSSTNPRTSFRVSVCLRRYFKDHRARCYIQVTRNRRVRWLEKRIQKVFTLSQPFCLCSNGHLLPSTEPLALLNPGDSIEVIPLKQTKEREQNTNNGSFNCSNVVSDSTQPILMETTSIDYEITNNNALNVGNEIIQNTKSVPDKKNTKLNSSIEPIKNVERGSHNMEAEYKSASSIDEADSAVKSLHQMKQHALKLIEDEVVPMSNEPVRRVRRRVRRRSRRSAAPVAAPAMSSSPLPLTSAPYPPHLRFSSPPLSPRTLSPLTQRCSSPQEVARNEEASARLPRVVRPLGVNE